MQVYVVGKEKELSYITKNGVDQSEFFVNEYGSEVTYDEEQEKYTMSADAYEWWRKVFGMMTEVDELEAELPDELKDAYRAENFGNDLDEIVQQQLEWLREHVK